MIGFINNIPIQISWKVFLFVLLSSHIVAEKQFDIPPRFQTFEGSSCNAYSGAIPTVQIGSDVNITLKVQQEMETLLFRRPEVGLVTCAPHGMYRLRLRSLLVLEFPLNRNAQPILDVVVGDCGNRLYVYVATHTQGTPSLLRKSLESYYITDDSSAFGEVLWEKGWKIAMIDCDLSDKDMILSDNAWEKPIMEKYRRLHDYVEAHNTHLVENRMKLKYPYVINKVPRPLKPRSPSKFKDGITVIVMTYNNIRNAQNAKKLLEKVIKIEYEGIKIVREVILLWNSDIKETFQPSSDYLEGGNINGNGRVVIAPTNDLQNRMNMTLIQPITAAILSLDDDSPLPSNEIFGLSYQEWLLNQGISLQGLQDSRGAPSTIKYASYHGELFNSSYAYLGHGHCLKGRSWMVENPFIYHQDYARAFSVNDHKFLHGFIRLQPSHPDDIAFGTFVNWASQMPAICIDEVPNKYIPHLSKQQHVQRQHMLQIHDLNEKHTHNIENTDGHHRRLGMSGGSSWLFLRSHGAMWILYYFGGFYNPEGCWIDARTKENPPSFVLDRQTHADCLKH